MIEFEERRSIFFARKILLSSKQGFFIRRQIPSLEFFYAANFQEKIFSIYFRDSCRERFFFKKMILNQVEFFGLEWGSEV